MFKTHLAVSGLKERVLIRIGGLFKTHLAVSGLIQPIGWKLGKLFMEISMKIWCCEKNCGNQEWFSIARDVKIEYNY